jgi:hypothetical protein
MGADHGLLMQIAVFPSKVRVESQWKQNRQKGQKRQKAFAPFALFAFFVSIVFAHERSG